MLTWASLLDSRSLASSDRAHTLFSLLSSKWLFHSFYSFFNPPKFLQFLTLRWRSCSNHTEMITLREKCHTTLKTHPPNFQLYPYMFSLFSLQKNYLQVRLSPPLILQISSLLTCSTIKLHQSLFWPSIVIFFLPGFLPLAYKHVVMSLN